MCKFIWKYFLFSNKKKLESLSLMYGWDPTLFGQAYVFKVYLFLYFKSISLK
jgi:hypothetical protein